MKFLFRPPSPPETLINVPANSVVVIIPRDFSLALLTLIVALVFGNTVQITLNTLHPPAGIVKSTPQSPAP